MPVIQLPGGMDMSMLANALAGGLYNQVGRFLDPTQAYANQQLLDPKLWVNKEGPSGFQPGTPWQAMLMSLLQGGGLNPLNPRYLEGQPNIPGAGNMGGQPTAPAGPTQGAMGPNLGMMPQLMQGLQQPQQGGAQTNPIAMILPALLAAMSKGQQQPQMPNIPQFGVPSFHDGGMPNAFQVEKATGTGGWALAPMAPPVNQNLSLSPQDLQDALEVWNSNVQNMRGVFGSRGLDWWYSRWAEMDPAQRKNYVSMIPRKHEGGGLEQLFSMMKLDRGEVPAILEKGEVVINKKAAEAIGPEKLDALNQMIPRYHDGTPAMPQAYQDTVSNPYFQPEQAGWLQAVIQAIQKNPELSGAIAGFPMGGPLGAVAGAGMGALGRAGVFQDPLGSAKGALQMAGNALIPEVGGAVRAAQGKPFYDEETQRLMGMGRYLPPDPLMKPYQVAPGVTPATGKASEFGSQIYSSMNLQAAGATSQNTQWVPKEMYDKNPGLYEAYKYNGKPMYFTDRQTGQLVVPTNMYGNKVAPKVAPPQKGAPPTPAPQPTPSTTVAKTAGGRTAQPRVKGEGVQPAAQTGFQIPEPTQMGTMGAQQAGPGGGAIPPTTWTPVSQAPQLDLKAMKGLSSEQLQQYLYNMASHTEMLNEPGKSRAQQVMDLYGQMLSQATGADVAMAQSGQLAAETTHQNLANNWDAMTADARGKLIGQQLDKEALDNSFARYLYSNKAYLDATLQKPIADYMLVRAQQKRWEAEAYYYASRAGAGPGSLRGDQTAIKMMTGLLQGQQKDMEAKRQLAQSGKFPGDAMMKQYLMSSLKYQFMVNPQAMTVRTPAEIAQDYLKRQGPFGGKSYYLTEKDVQAAINEVSANTAYMSLYSKIGYVPPEAMSGTQQQPTYQMGQDQSQQTLDLFGLPQ